jgi:branched-chain amino acid transport system ATP-binding protein
VSALLEVEGVTKRFRGLVAVDRVSLTVSEGEILAVIGPNGAGKTTLFGLIAGALTPDGGRILFEGTSTAGLRPDELCRKGIARTFQIVRPFPALTVHENAVVGAMLRTQSLPEAKREADAVLTRLGLIDKRDEPAKALTLPDRKRLEVARALATRPAPAAARRGAWRASDPSEVDATWWRSCAPSASRRRDDRA